MAKPDINHILARLKAKAKGEAMPIDPSIVQHLAPPVKGQPLPWADVLPPETEFEKAMRRAEALPVMRLGDRGPDYNRPYFYRGEVGPIQKLSELPSNEQGADELKAKHKAEAQAAIDAPYRGTPQERIALSHIRVKQATGKGKKLTHEEKRLLAKFDMAVFLARAGLNRRQG